MAAPGPVDVPAFVDEPVMMELAAEEVVLNESVVEKVLAAEQVIIEQADEEVSPTNTDATTRASTEPSVHTNGGFP